MISPCILLVPCVVKVAKNTLYRSDEIYADKEPMTQSKSSSQAFVLNNKLSLNVKQVSHTKCYCQLLKK